MTGTAMLTILIIAAFIFTVVIVIIRAVDSQNGIPSNRPYHYGGRVLTKGEAGEYWVSKVLGETVPGVRYVINDLTAVTVNGKTFQIDHVLIDERGILVIETKNFEGNIYGDETQQEWAQYCGQRVRYFQNPVWQNQVHVSKLEKLLGDGVPLASVIVFVRGNITHVKASNVYNFAGFKQILEAPSADTFLPPEKREEVYQFLMTYKQNEVMNKLAHQQSIERRNTLLANGKCPRCGSDLRLLQGQNGTFWGCSSYPNCNFTKRV